MHALQQKERFFLDKTQFTGKYGIVARCFALRACMHAREQKNGKLRKSKDAWNVFMEFNLCRKAPFQKKILIFIRAALSDQSFSY